MFSKMRLNFRLKMGQFLALLAMATMLTAAGTPVRAADSIDDVLNAVPKNAQVVVIVPNIGGLSKKITAFGKALGLGDIQGFTDPLGELKREGGIEKGLNENGAIIVVLSGLEDSIKNGEEPNFVVFMPVTDYNDFVANFKGEEKDGLVYRLDQAA